QDGRCAAPKRCRVREWENRRAQDLRRLQTRVRLLAQGAQSPRDAVQVLDRDNFPPGEFHRLTDERGEGSAAGTAKLVAASRSETNENRLRPKPFCARFSAIDRRASDAARAKRAGDGGAAQGGKENTARRTVLMAGERFWRFAR